MVVIVVDDDPLNANWIKQSTMEEEFSEHPAGQDLRTKAGIYERFVNKYQRELVGHYDAWAEETERAIASAIKAHVPNQQIEGIVAARIGDLQSDLTALGRRRIGEAGNLGLGRGPLAKQAGRPEVLRAIAQLQLANDQFLANSLMPELQGRLIQDIMVSRQLAEPQIAKEALHQAFLSPRYRPAQYSGGAWVAIFDTQKEAGRLENQDRQARGEAPAPVRWVLDPMADHCDTDVSRGTFGCPSLEGDYRGGWDDLPTVPAGNVSCLSNCRCSLEADFGGGWERVT